MTGTGQEMDPPSLRFNSRKALFFQFENSFDFPHLKAHFLKWRLPSMLGESILVCGVHPPWISSGLPPRFKPNFPTHTPTPTSVALSIPFPAGPEGGHPLPPPPLQLGDVLLIFVVFFAGSHDHVAENIVMLFRAFSRFVALYNLVPRRSLPGSSFPPGFSFFQVPFSQSGHTNRRRKCPPPLITLIMCDFGSIRRGASNTGFCCCYDPSLTSTPPRPPQVLLHDAIHDLVHGFNVGPMSAPSEGPRPPYNAFELNEGPLWFF